VGGGRAFAARPRDYTQKVNRKMYRAGMRSMLGQLVRTDRLVVATEFSVAEPRTRLLIERLKALALDNALIVIEAQDDKLMLAARNLPHIDVITVAGINPVALAAHDKVLMTVGAIKMIEERLQ
jgi:large subunit ribosomal protein L4